MLFNKTRFKVRSLQSLSQSRHQLSLKVAQLQMRIQAAAQAQHKLGPLTAYEVSLLKDRHKLQQHQQSLEAAAGITKRFGSAVHNVQIFLHWVASLHTSLPTQTGDQSKAGVMMPQICM